MKVKDLFFIIIGLILMYKFIFSIYKSGKINLHKPYTDKYPALEFEQFKSLYAVAPEKWKWITRNNYEINYHHFEYTTKKKNPKYQTPEELKRKYYDRMYDNTFYWKWAILEPEYKEVTKCFTYYIDEEAKIADFFAQKEKEKQEKKNAQEMLACLPFWKEDAENAAKRAREEILKAQTNYEEILNRMKGNSNG